MKKIMFNDRYGLTDAVLTGRKTMTRRIVKCPRRFKGCEDTSLEFHKRPNSDIWYDCVVCDADGHDLGQLPLPFEVGDVVAVAQSYKRIYDAMEERDGNCKANEWWCELYDLRIGDGLGPAVTPGYRNKMFVNAEYMPHRIRITDLWFERLQDISDEDAMREGIMEGEFMNTWDRFYYDEWGDVNNHITFRTPRLAFASLIDKLSGKGTWESNPFVFVYEFELIKN